jgi:hypothetical protein
MSITNRTLRRTVAAALLLTAAVPAAPAEAGDRGDHGAKEPWLAGRAVLPVETYAPGPSAGNFFGNVIRNGIQFPLASQPVEGFSGIVAGRRPGEYLAMPDNGFGTKDNSKDFLIRAYYLRPEFETRKGGSGAVRVGEFISFRDPAGLIGFPIVNEGTPERLLTGGDIDPESIQRGRHGDLWLGDEFGPWILHFDGAGRLVEPPIELPDGLRSPSNPHLNGAPSTVLGSRGIEAMAMSPDRRTLTVVLEGAVPVEDAPNHRRIYQYDTRRRSFTRLADYVADADARFIADAQAVSAHRLLVIERDNVDALVRKVYEVDLRRTAADGTAPKTQVVDLAAIPDPHLISLPAIHEGDVGLGNPFRVMCESIEALYVIDRNELLLGCDNNFPNSGRNPDLADDNEFIVVRTR